jgi:hypothetical protein
LGRNFSTITPAASRNRPWFWATDRAESIDQNVGFYATEGRPPERFRNASSGIVIFEDIAFQINFMDRPVQRRFDRRKIGFAVLQQGDLIVLSLFSTLCSRKPGTSMKPE